MIAQHSSASNEHYSPPEIVEAARAVMGCIDLDPASTESVNKSLVRAKTFYDKKTDGLTQPWHGNVWLNPPGKKIGNKSSAAVWWDKLIDEYHAERVDQAIFLGFSIEILATTQGRGEGCWIASYPFCVPRRRLCFLTEIEGSFAEEDSPTHANVIAYLPPRIGDAEAVLRFQHVFSRFGHVR